jgi:FkbM family methyltransferase
MSTITDKLRQYGVGRTLRFALSELVQKLYFQTIVGSYSQSKEDLLIDKLTGYKKNGFYVDVGAHDPYRFSNTMRFYRRGWHGVNIEPDVACFVRIDRVRTRDINLNIGVGEKRGKMEFFIVDPATLSTFSAVQAKAYQRQGFRIVKKQKVAIFPLREIFHKHVGKGRIDFLSMDVEGFEMSVLRGNDWKRFRPQVLCIETANADGRNIDAFLKTIGYIKVSDNGLNSLYTDART